VIAVFEVNRRSEIERQLSKDMQPFLHGFHRFFSVFSLKALGASLRETLEIFLLKALEASPLEFLKVSVLKTLEALESFP
jgi:hypothetical protein